MYSFLVPITPLAIFLIASGVIGLLPEGLLIVIPLMVTKNLVVATMPGMHKHDDICGIAGK